MPGGSASLSTSNETGLRPAYKKRPKWRAACLLPASCFGPPPGSAEFGEVKGGDDCGSKKGRGDRRWWSLLRWSGRRKKPERTVPVDAGVCAASENGARDENHDGGIKRTVMATELEPEPEPPVRCTGVPPASEIEVNQAKRKPKLDLEQTSSLVTPRVSNNSKLDPCCLVHSILPSSSITKLKTSLSSDEAATSTSTSSSSTNSRLFLTTSTGEKIFNKCFSCVDEGKLDKAYILLLFLAIILLMLVVLGRTVASVCVFPFLYFLHNGKETRETESCSNESEKGNIEKGEVVCMSKEYKKRVIMEGVLQRNGRFGSL